MGRAYFASRLLALRISSASIPVATGWLKNQASRISFAIAVDVLLRLMANTFASSHNRAPFAVSESQHRAARTPGSLLAAMLTPVPVQQKQNPLIRSSTTHFQGHLLSDIRPTHSLSFEWPEQTDLVASLLQLLYHKICEKGLLVAP